MDKAPKGATHFLIGDGIVDPWRDLSGPTWKWFYARGERWVDTEESSAAFIGRNAHRLQDLRVERDSAVADAAQWLWMNRDMVRRGSEALGATESAMILRVCQICKDYDASKAAEVANDPLNIIARLSEGDSENEYSEDECFVGEHLLQLGAEHVDDDANVYAATLYQIVTLLKNYGAPAFAPRAEVIKLSDAAFDAFEAALERPAAASPNLVKLLSNRPTWTVVDEEGATLATPATLEELARLREELATASEIIKIQRKGLLEGARPLRALLDKRKAALPDLLREAYESGYSDGQNSPSGYGCKAERDKVVAALAERQA